MTRRLGIAAALAGAVLLAGATPAAGDPPRTVSSYYLARADARLCPSPMCGGIWVALANKGKTTCGDGAARPECYAAQADLSRLDADERTRILLQGAITEGRALARGKLVRGRVPGYPELDTLVVSEVWLASSSLARPRGLFHRLRDNGVRCVTTPCFSIHAAELTGGRHANLSAVDLSRTGAPGWERRLALGEISRTGSLIAAGRIVRRPGGSRALDATQFYVRAPG